ncbi:hypothetical protein ACIA8O_16240 [Kitasatospora sp. NPDC051853]|uniref:hypothetical protein n=1 Tax=Kitasatospora sp. NPDC051853 TaxID=3364058 RepID=UPI0037A74468
MRLRTLAASLAVSTALALGTATPAAAHGDTIAFAVTALVDGHLTVTATWQNDHDPVDEKVAATVNATSTDGRAVGPWPLVAVPGPPGVYTTARQLPPGYWTVAVDSGFPALGHGEAELDVTAVPGTAPSPTATPSVPSTPSAPSSPSPAPSPSASPTTTTAEPAPATGHGTLVTTVALAVAVSVGAVLLVRRRRSR